MTSTLHSLIEASNDGIVWDVGYLVGKGKGKNGKNFIVPLSQYGADSENSYLEEISIPYKHIAEIEYELKVSVSLNANTEFLDIYISAVTNNNNSLSYDYFPETNLTNDCYFGIGFSNVTELKQKSFRDALEGITVMNREELYSIYRSTAKELGISLSTNGMDMHLQAYCEASN